MVPVKRIPKTTSGKIQRHLLEADYLGGVYAAELAELDALRAGMEADDVQSIHTVLSRTVEGYRPERRHLEPDRT